MAKNVKNRIRYNYNGQPLGADETHVLMPYCDLDQENIINGKSIVILQTAGGPVKAVLKAVPKKYAALATEQFNAFVRNDLPTLSARCLLPQADGTKKVCPKISHGNHPNCAHCPHRNEYERELPRIISLEELQEAGFDPACSGSTEDLFIRKEEKKASLQKAKANLNDLLEASPKHAYALCLAVQNVTGDQFYKKMHIGHDAAARVKKQISEYVAEHGLDNFSHFKASRSKLDAYYRKETLKALKGILDILLGLTVEK